MGRQWADVEGRGLGELIMIGLDSLLQVRMMQAVGSESRQMSVDGKTAFRPRADPSWTTAYQDLGCSTCDPAFSDLGHSKYRAALAR